MSITQSTRFHKSIYALVAISLISSGSVFAQVDAGALQQSNVGITLADDINNFTPACDAIFDAIRLP